MNCARHSDVCFICTLVWERGVYFIFRPGKEHILLRESSLYGEIREMGVPEENLYA
jgi:hypothetical protein